MALRSLIKILEDASTKVSHALSRLSEGDALGSSDGLAAFSFKDSSGDVVMPTVNSEGSIPVTFDAGTCLPFSGKVVTGSLTKDAEALIGTLVLASGKDYNNTEIIMSSFREFSYRIANTDDAAGVPVETDIAEGVVLSGDGHKNIMPSKHCFTSGSTGTQELRIYATPVENPDTIYTHGSSNEIA